MGADSLLIKKDDELCLLNTTKYQVKLKNVLGIPHGARAVFKAGGTIFVAMKDKKLLMFDAQTLEIKDIKRLLPDTVRQFGTWDADPKYLMLTIGIQLWIMHTETY